MLLFKKRFHDGLVRGEVTVTFRRWAKPHVRPGGRYRCHPIGVLEVDRVDRLTLDAVTEEDARRGGFASRDELVAYLREAAGGPPAADELLWRVELHHGGDGDRVEIALDDRLGADDLALLTKRLARLDAKRAWTRRTLEIIEKNPRVAASRLAKRLRRETLPFKVDVRKLKRLGLTQSFEVGYELSPRGKAYLALVRARRTRRARPS